MVQARELFKRYIWMNLNFYRIHLITFCLIPVISAAIMYACNGMYPTKYIDALFNSVSAMTVTGLTSINLSQLTIWQQMILYLQMAVGNIVTVSWIMVLVRKHFFEAKVTHIVENLIAQKHGEEGGRPSVRKAPLSTTRRILSSIRGSTSRKSSPERSLGRIVSKDEKLRPDMIRRLTNQPPQLLNPNGQISIKTPTMEAEESSAFSTAVNFANSPAISRQITSDDEDVPASAHPFPRTLSGPGFPRTLTVEFQEPEGITRRGRRQSVHPRGSGEVPLESVRTTSRDSRRNPHSFEESGGRARAYSSTGQRLDRTGTQHTARSFGASGSRHQPEGVSMRRAGSIGGVPEDIGFGGFPMPHQIFGQVANYFIPKISNKLHRSVSVPARTLTIGSQRVETMRSAEGAGGSTRGTDGGQRAREAPYISFDAIVGRNSQFYDLREEELEELGGVEYRALSILLWIVPLYLIGIQLIAFIVIAPYMALGRWQSTFANDNVRPVNSTWYSAFVIMSAFTNAGMSLVDTSMTNFKDSYPQIVFLVWIILAGNTCYPAFWCGWRSSRLGSRTRETLQFLLDHPRRCFVYLFPSHQTWFLLIFVGLLTVTDWVSFLLLDIGNAEIDAIPVGERMLDGLLQSAAVRAAGFGVVSLSNLAPAVKVLYVVMMYVSVYPIALSVRSSNVYEERSLGLAVDPELLSEDRDTDDDEEPQTRVWGSYLAWHARKQLAFDMWWIVLALVLICIVERSQIESESGIDIFSLLFEVISAYGTVGLSLGAPGQNYSLAGALHPLSKLILCAVMIRGRHRGLPVAIDRAVMLPHEFRDVANLTLDAHTRTDGGETTLADNEKVHIRRTSERVGLAIGPAPPPSKDSTAFSKSSQHTGFVVSDGEGKDDGTEEEVGQELNPVPPRASTDNPAFMPLPASPSYTGIAPMAAEDAYNGVEGDVEDAHEGGN
ncbi:TrkH-domain-containing protein [Clavulina sp. PMI_390]|nr:TrkH-domain-containing protein [Clavulina sp. PMI_390]